MYRCLLLLHQGSHELSRTSIWLRPWAAQVLHRPSCTIQVCRWGLGPSCPLSHLTSHFWNDAERISVEWAHLAHLPSWALTHAFFSAYVKVPATWQGVAALETRRGLQRQCLRGPPHRWAVGSAQPVPAITELHLVTSAQHGVAPNVGACDSNIYRSGILVALNSHNLPGHMPDFVGPHLLI